MIARWFSLTPPDSFIFQGCSQISQNLVQALYVWDSFLGIDAFHLPDIKRSQLGFVALGAQRDAGAIFTPRIYSHRNTLSPVRKHLHYAAIYEDSQIQKFL